MLKMIAGKLTNDKKPSLESAKRVMGMINDFKVLILKTGVAAKDINTFMKKYTLKKEEKFKIQSTSKKCHHNENVDSSILVLLRFLGHLNLNDLSQNVHGRDSIGRSNNGLNWSITI